MRGKRERGKDRGGEGGGRRRENEGEKEEGGQENKGSTLISVSENLPDE